MMYRSNILIWCHHLKKRGSMQSNIAIHFRSGLIYETNNDISLLKVFGCVQKLWELGPCCRKCVSKCWKLTNNKRLSLWAKINKFTIPWTLSYIFMITNLFNSLWWPIYLINSIDNVKLPFSIRYITKNLLADFY